MPIVSKSMNVICRCMSLYRGEELPHKGLKPNHHSFVLTVCAHPGLSQDRIARHLCLNKSTVTRKLDQLEREGLIRRESNPSDKRELLVYPTQAMLELYPRVREIARSWNALLTEDCTPEELEVFLSVLSRMTERARELVGCGEGESK